MIEIKSLTKVYKDKVAVDNLSFDIKPGIVTGFLGPNGAGKSTTMRMILNLVKPSKGEVIIDGKHYIDLNQPISKIGALIDADALNPKLTALQHLRLMTTASGIPSSRIIEMLEKTGLEKVKDKQIEEYSLGMKQRLGIAAALLGNPETVILDEPFNGLDVDGIKWLRSLAKNLAEEGKAVLVSSHLMSEVQAIAERIIVLAQGKLLADMSVEEISKKSYSGYLKIKSENNSKLEDLLKKNGAYISKGEEGSLQVRNVESEKIGIIAKENYIAIFELTRVQPSLEELFIELTEGKVDYKSK
ncbi:ABC transporter ATP-binding protein [Candidatus Galacturonibacter soehngenii]|uniref:ATP-binding cassette domain-containing protein n=1 Tax=Candidatus Galacturonatibacter soehngenii TaxID=2307010 RepID=A0A7V7UAY4_9FIRM|nr:ATP-binding cassette domain-containing protein [Candidatus Galacturonibacter soehngenii]KAB1435948.1 ATP-binding cassette domain-containing protein [Candidatus Galacturonibacter soehngenii]